MNDYIYWIWLSLAGGTGNSDYSLLLEYFEDAQSIYEAGIEEYSRVEGLSKAFAKELCKKGLDEAKEILDFCEKHSVRLLHCNEPAYPTKLKWIYDYPVLLYVYGELPNLNEKLSVAVVGTRSYTDYGRIIAYRVGGGLAKAGAVVISGLALGNDSFGHLGCLENGGKTIAVMGTGIDKIYPSEHRELAKIIAKNGAVITEYPPKSKGLGWHFPQRNRIISGLSDAVVIVEADARSGAMITASCATDQNRGVYAVPGDITSESSEGPISLIKDGAKPITNAYDVLEDFTSLYPYLNENMQGVDFNIQVPEITDTTFGTGKSYARKRTSEAKLFEAKASVKQEKTAKDIKEAKNKEPEQMAAVTDETAEPKCEGLDALQKKIFLKIAKSGRINAEELIEGENTADVMSALTTLEIMGYVEASAGGFYTSTL